jgi:putative heme iron utilization protein
MRRARDEGAARLRVDAATGASDIGDDANSEAIMAKDDDFSPVDCSRRLLRQARTAALATIARRTGHPFGSMVSVACEADGTPILLIATLAAHARNLAEDPRASLLFEDRTAPDPQQGGRVTVVGRVEKIADPTEAARRYLARLPEASLYAGFADFAFFRLVVEEAHLVAGFGRAMHVRARDLLLDLAGCEALVAAEPAMLGALAADPARLAALAHRLGGEGESWAAIGLDPEGLDLASTGAEIRAHRRLVLPERASSPDEFMALLLRWEESVPLQ